MPEILFRKYFNSETIRTKVTNLVKKSKLAVSFDGFSYSAYNGIEIHDVNISFEENFSKTNNFLSISKITIPLKWSLDHGFSPDFQNIELQKPNINIWIRDKKLSLLFKNQINDWLSENDNFNIHIKNAIVTVVFETKGYQKETWKITNVEGSIIKSPDKQKILFDYENNEWGSGTIAINPPICEANCNWLKGNYNWQFSSFMMRRLSWLIKPANFNSGEVSGNIVLTYDNKNQKNLNIKGTIKLNDLGIKNEDDTILHDFSVHSTVNINHNEKSNSLSFQGLLNGAEFNLEYIKDKDDLWPKEVSFTANKFQDETFFILPFGFKLYGIKDISFKLRKPKTSRKYRTLDANMNISNGQVYYLDKMLFLLPEMTFNMFENKYSGILNLKKNKSSLKIGSTGSIDLFTNLFSEIIQDSITLDNVRITRKIIGFESNHKANIFSENLYKNDLIELKEYLLKKWSNKLISQINEGWQASKIREREWFIKYMWKASIKSTIKVNNYLWDKSQASNFQGILNLENNTIEFNVEDQNRDNGIYINYNYFNNHPTVSGKLNFDLNSASHLIGYILPENILFSAENSSLIWEFKTSGERPIDLYNYFRGRGNFEFKNARLGSYFVDKEIEKDWKLIKGEAIAYTQSGVLSSVFSENEHQNGYFYGRWKTDNFFKDWQITFKIHEKNN